MNSEVGILGTNNVENDTKLENCLLRRRRIVVCAAKERRMNEDATPVQNLFKYFNQPFKDINWLYTSAN